MKILLIIILAAASAGLIYFSHVLEQRRKKYINGVKKFADENRRFEGTVMSVTKEKPRAVILKFRDEEQKKTIVHRYMFSHKRYKQGTAVTVFYDETSDSVCVEGDNPFVFKAMLCAAGSAICISAVIALIAVGGLIL